MYGIPFFERVVLFVILSLAMCQTYSETRPKIIVDADLEHFADDYEALVMLSTLHNRQTLELRGVTLVTGNHWLDQIEVDTLRLIERLSLQKTVGVFRGADRPLLHSETAFHDSEKKMYGWVYAGAWTRSKEIVAPLDGMPSLKSDDRHAVNFIIEEVRSNPGEVTIVALGPLTNIALAFRLAPDIIPKLKSIIYMGGTIYAPGNVTPSAEFNWWFDADAAQIVLGEKLHHVVIPLDATDKIPFDRKRYQQLVSAYPNHSVTKNYMIPKFKKQFQSNPDYSIPVWDTLVPAYMFDPSLVTEKRQFWLSIDANRGPNYGRVIPTPVREGVDVKPFLGAQKVDVIMSMDSKRFWHVYEELTFKK